MMNSIEFKDNGSLAISSVKIGLNNGMESPEFEKARTNHQKHERIDIKPVHRIGQVGLAEMQNMDGGVMWRARFCSKSGG